VFDERGLVPNSFKSSNDLSRLPVLSRRDMFDHLDDLISDRYAPADLLKFYTGGTTGQQAKLYVDQESFNIKQAITWRHESWMGCQPCDRLALFWPAHIDIPGHESWKARFARQHLLRTEMVQGGSMNESLARRLAEQLRRFNPDYMKVFPASFTNFIEYAGASGLPLPRPRAIMSTGEALYPAQRRLIDEAFGCPVFDMYGSREVGNTASECPAHQGMHVAMETSVVEFVKDGRAVTPGEEGEILVTDLTNYGMPLIRYQINDFGIPLAGSCSCGRELDRMDAAVGRLHDCFYGPDGTRHSGNVLGIHLTLAEDGVAVGQAQFIQRSLTRFLVRMTDKPEPSQETFNYLERRMKEIIGAGITVDFEVVARIPEEPSGKTRYVICEIPPPRRE
jgi:phenylacetate-CoA ligase